MGERVLLRGGYVLSMDDDVGELPTGRRAGRGRPDRRGRPRARGRGRRAARRDRARRHARLRRHPPPHLADAASAAICADWTLSDYFRGIRSAISPNCSRRGRLRRQLRRRARGARRRRDHDPRLLALQQHARSTPTRALQGLRDAGIRARLRLRLLPGADAAEPAFTDHEQRLADARRIRDDELASDDALVTMGIALTEVGLLPVRPDDRRGRARRASWSVPIVLHTGCSGARRSPRGSPSSTTTGCSAPSRCTSTATRSTTATSTGSPTTTARSPRARRPRSRWAWATR